MNPSIANPNKALWEKGDFTEIAAFMRQSGEVVVQSLGIKPPLRVLDLGCGDGTTAVPLARSEQIYRRTQPLESGSNLAILVAT